MNPNLIFCAGTTPAVRFAKAFLDGYGFSTCQNPDWNCRHLLLDVPSFRPGSPYSQNGSLDTLLESLPKNIIVWGGNLQHPSLKDTTSIDLLQDEFYLAENAAITAHCAINAAAPLLTVTLQQCPVLITGWGRIGKCLSSLLKDMGADVTVASRKASDRAILQSLGYRTSDYSALCDILPDIRLIYNTVPDLVLPENQIILCKNCIKIDLASRRGIWGNDVVWARGLPGIQAPESSGKLIADTICRRMKEVTS